MNFLKSLLQPNRYAEEVARDNPLPIAEFDAATGTALSRLAKPVAYLPSAARTATVTGADIANSGERGIYVYVNITAASGTGGLRIGLQGKDPASGAYYYLTDITPAAGTWVAIAKRGGLFYPATMTAPAGATEINPTVAIILPDIYRVQIVHADATSYTYSVGLSKLY